MPVVATVVVTGDGLLLGETIETFPEATITVHYQASSEATTFLVEGCDLDRFEAALECDETVNDPRITADFGDRRVYMVAPDVDRPGMSSVAVENDIQVGETVCDAGETGWRFELRLPHREALVAVREFLAGYGFETNVERLYTEASIEESHAPSTLTPAQRDAVRTAYDLGYFDEPRAADLQTVADALDISPSAASGRLRRAFAALVESHVP